MAAWYHTRWGLQTGVVGLGALLLASCGTSSHETTSLTSKASVAARVDHARHPRTPRLPAPLAAAVTAFSSTPMRFEIAVHEQAPGVAHRPTVYGAWDPSDRDGEVAIIAANGGVESAYGASRVVAGHSWSLISGHWYSVGFGQQEIGQILAVVGVMNLTGHVHASASQVISGATCLGYSGQLSKAQIATTLRHGPATLKQALAGIQQLRYSVYVGAGYVRGLEVAAVLTHDRLTYHTQWTVTFPGWGTPLRIRPPLAASVLPGSAPSGGLLPL
ncbi:MAG: hypothetical protein ACP5HZ_06250 [Ferrimicrobium sp.]